MIDLLTLAKSESGTLIPYMHTIRQAPNENSECSERRMKTYESSQSVPTVVPRDSSSSVQVNLSSPLDLVYHLTFQGQAYQINAPKGRIVSSSEVIWLQVQAAVPVVSRKNFCEKSNPSPRNTDAKHFDQDETMFMQQSHPDREINYDARCTCLAHL
jgi:hypothetical protein